MPRHVMGRFVGGRLRFDLNVEFAPNNTSNSGTIQPEGFQAEYVRGDGMRPSKGDVSTAEAGQVFHFCVDNLTPHRAPRLREVDSLARLRDRLKPAIAGVT